MLAGISVEKLLSMDLTFLHFLQAEELMVLLPDWFYKNVCKKKVLAAFAYAEPPSS